MEKKREEDMGTLDSTVRIEGAEQKGAARQGCSQMEPPPIRFRATRIKRHPDQRLPQCDAWRGYPDPPEESEWLDPRCLKKSDYSINGLNYCKRHAEAVALELMLEKELVVMG